MAQASVLGPNLSRALQGQGHCLYLLDCGKGPETWGKVFDWRGFTQGAEDSDYVSPGIEVFSYLSNCYDHFCTHGSACKSRVG